MPTPNEWEIDETYDPSQEDWEIDESFDPTFEVVRPLKEAHKKIVTSAAASNKAWVDKYGRDMSTFYSEIKSEGKHTEAEQEDIKRVIAELHDPFVNKRKPQGKAWHEEVLEDEKYKPDTSYQESRKHKSAFTRYAEDVVQGLEQVGIHVLTTALTGPIGGMSFMVSQIQGSHYLQMRQQGVDPERSFIGSLVNAVVQAPMEQIPFFKVLKLWKVGTPVSKAVKNVISTSFTEFMTEWFQKYPELITTVWAKTPDASFDERLSLVIQGLWQATKEGMYEGLVATPLSGGARVGKIVIDTMRGDTDDPAQAIYDSLTAEEQTKINVEVNNLTEDGHTEEAALTDSLQKHIEQKQKDFSELLEKVKNLDEAMDIDEVVKNIKKRVLFQQPIKTPTRDNFFKDMKKQYSEDEVKNYEIVFDGVAQSWADRNNKKPEDFYHEVIGGFTISKAEDFDFKEAAQTLNQAEKTIKEIIDKSDPKIKKALEKELSKAEAAQDKKDLKKLERRQNKERPDRLGIDEVTGIPVSNIIRNKLKKAVKDPNKYILFFDIDDFKAVNDIHGHDKGDYTLKITGEFIREHFKGLEYGRYGGEEFAVIMAEKDLDKIEPFLNAFPERVTVEGEPVTISAGVAKGKKGKKLYADELNYEAKEGGKNRIVVDMEGRGKYNIEGKQVGEKSYVTKFLIRQTQAGARKLLETSLISSSEDRSALERAIQTLRQYESGSDGGRHARERVLEKQTQEVDHPYRDFFFQNKARPRGTVENLLSDIPKIIHTFEGADVSTPIHELGHIITQMMWLEQSSDYYTLAEWAGIEADRAQIGTTAWTEQELEKAARAFEAYCMEGNAPTTRLQQIFSKMKQWLIDIYRSVSALDVKINDNVRVVFDRWVSTEFERQSDPFMEVNEWLKADDLDMHDQQQMTFEEARELDPANIYEYDQVTAKARKKVLGRIAEKRVNKEKKLEKAFMKEAEDSVQNDDFYVMMNDLKASGGLKLSDLYDLYDKDYINDIRMRIPGLVSKDGVNADFFATQWEYYATDDLVQDILSHPTKKQAVQEYYDSLWTEYEIGLDYENATSYEDIINEEINILNEMLGRKKPKTRTDLKKTIREQTGQIKPEEYRQLVSDFKRDERLARDAFREGKKTGGIEKALKLKEAQRNRVAKLRHNFKNQKEKTKIDRRMKQHWKSPSIPETYKAQIVNWLSEYYPIPERYQLKPEINLEKFLKSKEETDEIIVKQILVAMKERPVQKRNKKGYRVTLTPKERDAVADVADMLAHMGRTEHYFIKEQNQRKIDEAVREMSETGYKTYKKKPEYNHPMAQIAEDDKLGWFRKKNNDAKAYIAQLRKAEFIFQALDGWEFDGPNWQIFQWIKKAEDAELKLGGETMKKLEEAFKPFHKESKSWAWKKYEIPGVPKKHTKERLIMIALNSGNEGNKHALREGLQLTDEQIDMVWKMLDKKEQKLVKDVWKILESLYPKLNEIHKELTGTTLRRVEGYYFPLDFDKKLSRKVAQRTSEQEFRNMFKSQMSRASVESGSRIARVGSGDLAPRLGFSVITNHITSTIHDITHQVPVRNAQKILSSEQYRKMVSDTAGEEIFDQLMPWLQHVARPMREPITEIEKWIRNLRRNTTTVALGWKVSVASKQFLSITQTIDEVGFKNTMQAIGEFYGDAKKKAQFIKESSVMMANRRHQWDRELNEFRNSFNPKEFRGKKHIRDSFFAMVGMMDLAATYPTWLAGYNTGMGKFNNDEAKAVEFADMVVRRTQPVASPKDLSMFQRGGLQRSENIKILGMFYTFFSGYHQRLIELRTKHKLGHINTVEAFKSFMWITIVPAIMSSIIAERGLPDEPEEYPKAVLSYLAAGFPLLRDIAGPWISDYGYSFSPIVSGLKSISALPGALIPDDEDGMEKSRKRLISGAGYIFGLPAAQMNITMEGILDLWNGKTSDPTRLLFREKKKKKHKPMRL